MANFLICLLGLLMTDSALCGWHDPHWHYLHDHEKSIGDKKTDSKLGGTSDEYEGKDGDMDNVFVHEHHHHHYWHNHPEDSSLNEKVSGGKHETKCHDKNHGNVEEKKLFFGCMVSKLIEKCIKNCHVTNDFDSLCGTKECTVACGIDPSMILSKVCPPEIVVTPTHAPTTDVPVHLKTTSTPRVVIAVDGSFINLDKTSDNNSEIKTNTTDTFKTPILAKAVTLHSHEEHDKSHYKYHSP